MLDYQTRVTTNEKGFTHSSRNWTTPVTVDLKTGAVSLIKQADR